MPKSAILSHVEPRLVERLTLDPALVEELAAEGLQRALDSTQATSAGPDAVHLGGDWHALHFELTGRADVDDEPLSWAILGGRPAGGSFGGGTVRLLGAAEVRRVAGALAHVRPEELSPRVDAQVDAEVYRACGDAERLAAHLRRLVRCYLAAAASGRAMLLVVTSPVAAPVG